MLPEASSKVIVLSVALTSFNQAANSALDSVLALADIFITAPIVFVANTPNSSASLIRRNFLSAAATSLRGASIFSRFCPVNSRLVISGTCSWTTPSQTRATHCKRLYPK